MQGKLIILEGIDGSGKATQAKLLIDSLSQLTKVSYFDFPRYEESLFGNLYGRCLKGEFGDHDKISPYLFSLPLMLDRGTVAPKIREALSEGYVICNRYTTSSLAHQSAKLPPEEREAFRYFVEQAEYGELGLPKPDFVIYLSLPNAQADKLVTKKSKRQYLGESDRDQAEKDTAHQQLAAQMYQELADERDDWYALPCCDEKGELFSPNEIRHKILNIVLPKVDEELLRCMMK